MGGREIVKVTAEMSEIESNETDQNQGTFGNLVGSVFLEKLIKRAGKIILRTACRAVFGTWGFFRTMHRKTAPSC